MNLATVASGNGSPLCAGLSLSWPRCYFLRCGLASEFGFAFSQMHVLDIPNSFVLLNKERESKASCRDSTAVLDDMVVHMGLRLPTDDVDDIRPYAFFCAPIGRTRTSRH